MQRALIQYRNPKNYELVMEATQENRTGGSDWIWKALLIRQDRQRKTGILRKRGRKGRDLPCRKKRKRYEIHIKRKNTENEGGMDMRIAIVTGASSGIGREFVNQIPGFYKHLDEIWVTARRGERLEEVKQEVEGRTGVYVRIFAGDLEKDLVYKQILNRLENQSPDIRMLVNAAGFGKIGSSAHIAKEDAAVQLRMIDVNCRSLPG